MRYCGREFDSSDIDAIKGMLAENPEISRYRLSTRVCEAFNWRKPNGGLKDMSCRVALLRMHADGHIMLPPPRCAKPLQYIKRPEIENSVDPPDVAPAIDLRKISVDLVKDKQDSLRWNAYVERYHYLGYQLIPGAQLRYFIRANDAIIALMSFGASAWKVKPRDEFIDWNVVQRKRNLHFIVNNARFLILPWIKHKNLASRILGLIAKRLSDDWQSHYSYRPVLLETFVQDQEFKGTCYKAANWLYLGKTQGRGKLDRHNECAKPVKSIWVYPLSRDFRTRLRT